FTGQERRAEAFANEYQESVEKITQRLAAENKPQPKIYTEYGASGVNEVGYTFGKNMWGAISTMAGGEIFQPLMSNGGENLTLNKLLPATPM
ncbi:hypothetical protein P8631_16440, partial [Guyparkeria sp. 1SP6A2]|nr:hypothetical protein [Guyparkeria sp. 1SP6A2]